MAFPSYILPSLAVSHMQRGQETFSRQVLVAEVSHLLCKVAAGQQGHLHEQLQSCWPLFLSSDI